MISTPQGWQSLSETQSGTHSPKCRNASRIAGSNGGKHCAIAFGFPGRLMMSERPRTPAVARDKMDVGATANDCARIVSPNPGNSRVITASVASGVTSRAAKPVPPVVIISGQSS